MLSPNTLLQNRYRVLRRIGQGGMGAVYEATHEGLGHTVALKETLYTDDEELRLAFRREARLLAGLRHPALPRVSDYFTEGDGLYLVMEYVPGDDLAEMLRRRGRAFPVEEVLRWAGCLLDVLDYLHTRDPPIIHRDIKPSNIKVGARGEVSLLDFGLAKGSVTSTVVISLHGGTLAYAPPEQLHQQGTDARSDLFSLAATLYQLLTGELAAVAPARLFEVAEGRPDSLRPADELSRQIPSAVAAVLTRALSLDRERRPESAAEMRRMLRGAVELAPPPPVAPPAAPQPPTVVDGDQTPAHPDSKADASPHAPQPAPSAPGGVWVLSREIATRNNVWGAVPSPDGRLLASIGGDTTVKLWDAATGDLRQKLTGHTLFLQSVAFSPDGGLIVSGAMDATARLWDLKTGEMRRVLKGHGRGVASVAFSPDGRVVCSGSDDNNVRLWDAATGELLRTLEGHSRGVQAVAFSHGGELLASGSYDTTIKIWDAATGELLRTLLWHDDAVRSVAFAPDGTLASGSGDGTLRLWDARTGELLRTLEHGEMVFSVAFAPDGRTVAGAGGAVLVGKVSLWDVRTGELRQELKEHGPSASSVAFSPDGAMLVSAGGDKTVKLWRLEAAPAGEASGTVSAVTMPPAQPETPERPPSSAPHAVSAGGFGAEVSLELLWEVEGHAERVNSVAFSPDGMTLVSGSQDRLLKLWDARTGELKDTFIGHREGIAGCAFSPDGATLASKSNDYAIKLWDARTGELINTFIGNNSLFTHLFFTLDGESLVSLTTYGVELRDARTGELRQELGRHEQYLNSVALSDDGRILASGSYDYVIKLWDLRGGGLLRTLEAGGQRLQSMAFSPDGATLATGGGDDRLVTLWDVRSGEVARRLKGHDAEVRRLAFSPGGETLASGSNDGTIKLWDLERGRLRQMLMGYNGSGAPPVMFLGGGRAVASGCKHCLCLWDAQSGELRQTLGPPSFADLRALALSLDGRALAGGSGNDKAVRLWRVVRPAS